MKRSSTIQAYVLDQARELIGDVGLKLAPAAGGGVDAHEILSVLHSGAREKSMPEDLRCLLRAEAQLVAGRTDEAEEKLRSVIEWSSTSAGVRSLALDRLGDIAWWRGDFAAAAAHYRESLSVRPDSERTKKDLSRALWHLGKPDAARKEFGFPSAPRVDAPAGDVLHVRQAGTILEVNGLYVSPQGAGVLVLQGCLEEGDTGLVATGSLGMMAQEACDLAWSIWRRSGSAVGRGVRIHAAQAGILKDGPSLGLAVYTLFGAVLGRLNPQPGDSFTGELDLKGRVLPIGGAREKALAAYLTGLRRLFLPAANLDEIKDGFKAILDLHPVSHVDQLIGELK